MSEPSAEPPFTTAEQPAPIAELFRFKTSLMLQEATGLRAANLPELVGLLDQVPEACIYYHTHYFLLQHHFLIPEPTHDFAYWVGEVLGERPLGELLASVDTIQYADLKSLREALANTINDYLQAIPAAAMRFVSPGSEFFFTKSVYIIMPTAYTAGTLREFAEALQHISLHSLYFHIFDARLRLGRPANDFSVWFEHMGLRELAEQMVSLDPYAHTLEALRSIVLSFVQHELQRLEASHAKPG